MLKNVFINGKFLEESEAKIDIDDLGLLRGYGIFKNIRTYNKKPFLLDMHLEVLFDSAEKINLNIPYSKSEITRIIRKLLILNRHKESVIRIVVTGGSSDDGMFPTGKPTFFITNKLLIVKKEIIEHGVKLITYEHQRNLPQVKTLDYLNLIIMKDRLKKEKAHSLLLIKRGIVLEGAVSNIFVIMEGKIYTPKKNVLKGVTRNFVIRLATKNKYQIVEGEIKLQQLLNSDEVFITGTTYGIIPVVQIDNKRINKGKVGPVTRKLVSLYSTYIKQIVF